MALACATGACVASDTGAKRENGAGGPVRIALDRERCFTRPADDSRADGPLVASPTRPQPRIASPGPPINGTAQEPRLAILNRTGEPVVQLYWKSGRDGDWSADQIGDDGAITSERFCTAQVTKPAQVQDAHCRFDFRAVTASGRSVTVTGVNVCSARRITLE